MSARKFTLEEVNRMDYPEFISVFGSVVENGPLAAATCWSSRPFSTPEELYQAFNVFMQSLTPQAKAGLVRCHPDLAGKLAKEGSLSRESESEQRAAGLLGMTESERKELAAVNSSYSAKFGFPFVVCARENKKEAIMTGIKSRLENSGSVELEKALGEISKIVYHRLVDIVKMVHL